MTGASGLVGSHVVEALKSAGHEVRALVRPTSDRAHLDGLGVEIATGDVTDRDSLRRACQGVECVFHTAAVVSSYGDWSVYRDVGVDGTANAIGAAADAGATRFVHLGSVAVYGFRHRRGAVLSERLPYDEDPEPWNHYVREKVLSEKLVWAAHAAERIRATSLRPSVILGVRDRNVAPRMLRALDLPVVSLAGLGGNRVPCVVVEDLARAAVGAAVTPAAVGNAYNLSSRSVITQAEIFREFARAAGRPAPLLRSPYGAALIFAGALEKAYSLGGRREEPFLTRMSVALMGHDVRVDCSSAAADLGWRGDSDLGVAIRRSVEWHRERDARAAAHRSAS